MFVGPRPTIRVTHRRDITSFFTGRQDGYRFILLSPRHPEARPSIWWLVRKKNETIVRNIYIIYYYIIYIIWRCIRARLSFFHCWFFFNIIYTYNIALDFSHIIIHSRIYIIIIQVILPYPQGKPVSNDAGLMSFHPRTTPTSVAPVPSRCIYYYLQRPKTIIFVRRIIAGRRVCACNILLLLLCKNLSLVDIYCQYTIHWSRLHFFFNRSYTANALRNTESCVFRT